MADDEAGQEETPPPPPSVNIIIEPDKMAGVWANFSCSLWLTCATPRALARASWFVTQLIDALQSNWGKYAARAMPKEVRDAGSTDDPPEDPEPSA